LVHIYSYVVFHADLGFNLNNKWNFRLNVNNLFNEDSYSTVLFASTILGDTPNFIFTTQHIL